MDHPKNRLAEKISRRAENFTPSDRIIADYLLRAYPLGLMQNASEIAEALNVNTSTVTRFFPKIGYANIKAARTDFREDIRFLINSPLDRFRTQDRRPPAADDAFSKAMEKDWANIQKTMRGVDSGTVSTFFDLLADPRRAVYTLGTRKEFSLAYYFSYQIASFRNDTRLLHPTNLVDQLANIRTGDILVVFDFRRYSRMHAKACRYAGETGAKVVVFADSPITPACAWADCLFLVNTSRLSVFDSYTAGMTLINALMAVMIERHGKKLESKYERLESLYKQFDVFIFQKEFSPRDQLKKEDR